jgi:starch synthase
MAAIGKGRTLHRYDGLLGEPARLVAGKIGGHPLIVLDAPGFFARDGGPYADAAGTDWPDNWRRFAALSRAAADLAGGAVRGQRFDLLHAHDWQGAMAPAYSRFTPYKAAPPSVLTIHNIAFQGHFGGDVFKGLALPKAAFSVEGVEYHGGVGFLKAGLASANVITTVSPSYAAEIRSPEFGMGLDGLIMSRGDRVRGIVNGIDTDEWNPATDKALVANYTARTLAQRAANKRALESDFGLERSDGPLFIVVTRLTWQKGMDVLLEVIDHLVGIGGRLAILGSGDAAIETGLETAAARHAGRVGVRIGYDEALSHRMQGGGDAILVPSRFEPCGLTQLYGLAYGCVPIVARTGGLSDTVIDANPAALNAGVATGVQFNGVNYHALSAAISRTVALYHQPAVWRGVQRNGMKADFSWARSGRAYADLYAQLVAENA